LPHWKIVNHSGFGSLLLVSMTRYGSQHGHASANTGH
jgi:hypothetical protein